MGLSARAIALDGFVAGGYSPRGIALSGLEADSTTAATIAETGLVQTGNISAQVQPLLQRALAGAPIAWGPARTSPVAAPVAATIVSESPGQIDAITVECSEEEPDAIEQVVQKRRRAKAIRSAAALAVAGESPAQRESIETTIRIASTMASESPAQQESIATTILVALALADESPSQRESIATAAHRERSPEDRTSSRRTTRDRFLQMRTEYRRGTRDED